MKYITDFFYIILGNTLIALGISDLLVHNHIITGGVSGFGILADHFFGLNLPLTVGIANAILFIAGYLAFGKEFSLKTVLSSFYFPVALGIFQKYPTLLTKINDLLIISILAGCFIGLGVGLVLKREASTGGVDILALLLNKYFDQPISSVMRAIDIVILTLQMAFADINQIVYGIVSVIIISYILNKTLTQGHDLAQILIISHDPEKVRELILFNQDAGLTMLKSETGYLRQSSYVLMTIVPYRKLTELKNRVNKIDSNAFVIVSQISEVGCRGTTNLRTEVVE